MNLRRSTHRLLIVTAALSYGLNARATLPIEQTLSPEGREVAFAKLKPRAIALSPDRRLLVTAGADLVVMDAVTGVVRQNVAFPPDRAANDPAEARPNFRLDPAAKTQSSFCGLVFSPRGDRLFLSGDSGAIKVFSVDAAGGVTAWRSFLLPGAHLAKREAEIPAGLAVSADGRRLYVAANLSNGLLELDAETGGMLRRFEVGVAPYDVVLCGAKAYVSNWGGRRPVAESLTGPGGLGTTVRVDPVRYIASEGSVTVVDLDQGRVLTELLTGRHASGLARTPSGRHVAVANANEDTVSIIDTEQDRVVETISLRWNPTDLFGASPNALTFDASGRTLYVCNGTQNAIAVLATDWERQGLARLRPRRPSRLDGLIPTGWFPAAIALDPAREMLFVANLKGEGEESGSPGRAGFTTHQYIGSISLAPVPDAARLQVLTAQVLANYREAIMQAAALPARPNQPPRPVPERVGEPSVLKHVIYVIKENRTYDQILGDMKEGNGDPALCVFGEDITPNLHRLAREFVLLDNTYCAGILSADGHQWATTAIATDYLEKSFPDFLRSYPFGGQERAVDALAYSSAGFIWDDALAHRCSVRNYGEFTLDQVRWKDPKKTKTPGYKDIWRDYQDHTGLIELGCEPSVASLRGCSKLDTVGWNLNVSDQYRMDRFLEEFRSFEKNGGLPALIILYLPNDHMQGTKPGVPVPAAYQADNDLAIGRLVAAVSHSVYWRDTGIFAMEDDPQNGWDHVSGYRTTAYVASAYARRHATVSERYSQPGMLRTIELILGLPPMNQMDAAAAPMSACFMAQPDLTPFDAVPNRVPLDRVNPDLAALRDATARRDAQVSARLPLDQPDMIKDDVLNRILWRAQKGPRAPYPTWAVLSHPVDDDD